MHTYNFRRSSLDRSQSAGHKLHVAGYVREAGATALSIPNVQARLRICYGDKCTGPHQNKVKIDPKYGSFNHSILFTDELVNLLGYNPVSMDFQACASTSVCTEQDWRSLESIQVTISDPRPPTAELMLTGPVWAAPNTTIALNGTTVSLLGADVSGAQVQIIWSVLGPAQPIDGTVPPPEQGIAGGVPFASQNATV
jgi:hypothetical protein